MTGLVHGVHAVTSLLERRPRAIREALLQAGRPGNRRAALAAALEAQQIPVRYVSRTELDKLTGGARHQGVAVRVSAPALESESALKDLVAARGEHLCLLVLDGVQDPRNLGACLRTAAAAGADAVVTPKDRAARLTPAAIKAAAGAAELIPVIRVTNLAGAQPAGRGGRQHRRPGRAGQPTPGRCGAAPAHRLRAGRRAAGPAPPHPGALPGACRHPHGRRRGKPQRGRGSRGGLVRA